VRSLSTRLTVFIAVAMAVVLLALGATIFTVLRNEVVQEAIRTAQTTAQATRQNFLNHGGDLDVVQANSSAYLFGARPDEIDVQFVSPLGNVVQASQTPYLPVPVQLSQSVQGMITWKNQPASYVSLPIVYHGLLLGAIQVSVSLAASFDALQLLRTLLIEGGVAGLALVALVGYLFARRALRPVERLTTLATRISDTDLSRRLEGASPRDELGRLAQAFNRMLDRLEAAFMRQARFVSDASHELKTPLAVISGYAELLQRWAAQDPQVREEAVSTISREAARMQRLVQDLLFLARGAQGLRLELRRMDLGELVGETVSEAQALPGLPRVVDETREVVPAQGDWDLLKQLLWILLDNAIKYGGEGNTVHVLARAQGAVPVLEVRDEGPGMSEEVREHAFERFYRADPARAAGGGAGLGLAIAREIAEAHRARLELLSGEGQGTTVRCLLPLDAESDGPAQAGGANSGVER